MKWPEYLNRLRAQIIGDADLTPAVRLVGIGLLMFLNQKTRTCWPGASQLAAATGFKRRFIFEAT